jgi:hypothetical protein
LLNETEFAPWVIYVLAPPVEPWMRQGARRQHKMARRNEFFCFAVPRRTAKRFDNAFVLVGSRREVPITICSRVSILDITHDND